ncbi:ADP-ribosyl cyclase/cyclic ADP-ribose hydrolase 1 [Neophocaena asiaeorientalis asiaeorientalis]|uniref:ADP-ribosyl cyclase/cyclic ADP-ribose hydrolase 1 n=1 Tax=Neophocaena asiaeorientalis asiaeorientalis TaxID=1706337 RepID=A0A341B7C7_NEOAA|nr:ADP-ribosyl cyclase/cyclic ADP-ribose hydrolase 1 [Neophocaena asiaeorientalis asiaeorientalis]
MADSRPKKAKICLCIFLCLLVVGVIAVVVGVRMWRHSSEHMKWNGTGSTAHFQEIVLERCYNYMQLVQPELRDRDCQKIREAFRNAFISKDPCSATEEDYHPLMKLVDLTVPCDKTVFWSKTKELAHQYTKVRREMFTLEDTLLGYIADDLNWCGDAGSNEMNYQSCPHWKKDCSNNFVSVFWDLVSKRFAENACGVVQVVLNGSISNAFDRKSTFGRVEVHNLNPTKVHTLQAWVIHDLGKLPSDSCSGSSINDLRWIIMQRNIKFTCQDNYSSGKFLQCVKKPEDSSCR